ncbi:MAG: glutamine-hydrolyzing carbamoyl-phosphate synthase small subunit [Bacteroidales bacterium]|nr:glutamine-hydrolyzing carbamoyl-phosphate synthase small subunit [Bacteroidales bacterium]MDD4669941.1 glutamine-hydrolyzing carbamoyl-phosphate synthase small subunit [Bacteroidales bacterium]
MQILNRTESVLQLQNGLEFQGFSFGYEAPSDGETVFSTAMVGYPESLTDPSYSGQILCVTYPLIGNYGVPENKTINGISENFESENIYVRGLIISDYSFEYSHWSAVKSLDQWLKENKIPGIYGIDTRELTKVLREGGSLLGKIIPAGCKSDWNIEDPNTVNQVGVVSCKEVIRYGSGDKKIVLVDCGVKHNILRCFVKRGIEIIRVPWDYNFNDGSIGNYDGLFISNGPGNPEFCDVTVQHIRETMNLDKPIFGICMGNQLLCRAGGAKTFKLKYGHRSHNQPVMMVGSNRCFITSQNHGYAVDNNTLGKDWEPYFINMNDGTNEGIRHKSKPFFSAQFHPEASSGPVDTEFLFDEFIKLL